MKPRRNLFLGSILVVFSMAQAAFAASGTWSGTTTATWDTTATNWTVVTGTPWDSTNGATNTATFNLASLAATVSSTVYTNGITFSTTGGLSGGIINLAGTTPGISVATSQTGTIGSTISGSAGLTKTSAGTLILSGSNNYTGGTAINAGTVQVNSGGTLGATSGALSMGTGSAGTIGTVGNLTVNTNTQVGAFSVVSNTSNTTTSTNIGQLSIASSSTLTVSSLAMGLASAISYNTNTALATGATNTGGTLTVSGNVTIGAQGNAGVSTQVLNLSGLTNFNAGSGASNFFRVGYGAVNASNVTLASTANVINVGILSVGETVSNGNSSQNPALNLGVGTNALQANTIQIGTQKASGVLQFSHASNGSVVITGADGSGVSNIFVGNQSGFSYQSANLNNKLLLAGHTAMVNAGTVNVARRTSTGGGNAVIADLTFDTGSFTTTGNVTMAQISAVAATNGATGTFTLGTTSVSTGELTVGTTVTPRHFVLADNQMITNNYATNGSFIINGGTATIHGNILDTSTTTTGTSTTTLTLDGGTLDMTSGNIGGDGSSGNRAITTLNFRSGTLKNVAQINNGAGLTKTTTGTLVLEGTNAYTGNTTVSAGKLVINGSISTSSAVTVEPNATLGGSGSMGAVTVQSGGNLSPGNSPGVITQESLTFADNANFNVEIDKALSPTNDRVTLTGDFANALSITDGANLFLNLSGTFKLGDCFVIVSYAATNATWSGGLFNLGSGTDFLNDDSKFVYGGYDWRINYDDTNFDTTNSTENYTDNGKYVTLTVIPEPGAALLGGLGMLALLRRRRD